MHVTLQPNAFVAPDDVVVVACPYTPGFYPDRMRVNSNIAASFEILSIMMGGVERLVTSPVPATEFDDSLGDPFMNGDLETPVQDFNVTVHNIDSVAVLFDAYVTDRVGGP